MTKNGGRIWAHDWENSVVDPLGERSSQTVAASQWHRAERVRARRPSSGTRSSDNRQIRVFLVLRYISPLATSRSAVRPWMVRWSSRELHRTIQLRSPSLNALSLRRYQTARILHASLHRWLD